jgi:hypothetical protein
MNSILTWMLQRYPLGFFFSDLTKGNLSSESWNAIPMLNTPLLFHVSASQIQQLIQYGASPSASCYLIEQEISATLGDVALKSRRSNADDFFLAIFE